MWSPLALKWGFVATRTSGAPNRTPLCPHCPVCCRPSHHAHSRGMAVCGVCRGAVHEHRQRTTTIHAHQPPTFPFTVIAGSLQDTLLWAPVVYCPFATLILPVQGWSGAVSCFFQQHGTCSCRCSFRTIGSRAMCHGSSELLSTYVDGSCLLHSLLEEIRRLETNGLHVPATFPTTTPTLRQVLIAIVRNGPALFWLSRSDGWTNCYGSDAWIQHLATDSIWCTNLFLHLFKLLLLEHDMGQV